MEPGKKPIESMQQLLDGYESFYWFGRALYKYGACGPWAVAICDGCDDVYYESEAANKTDWWPQCIGIKIGSIVEGSDVEVGPETLLFPFTTDDLDDAVEAINAEASFYWERDNTRSFMVLRGDETVAYGRVGLCVDVGFEGADTSLDLEALGKVCAQVLDEYDDFERHPVPGFPGLAVKEIDHSMMTY